ncbi:MAG: hypothetical protein F6K58_14725 [Symploca sp. SIO2E9]|nr:hypothetical protein [Symploca sp. SIO2E9]
MSKRSLYRRGERKKSGGMSKQTLQTLQTLQTRRIEFPSKISLTPAEGCPKGCRGSTKGNFANKQ